jgi:Flp pilus assembly CpaE family ATPase
VSGEEHILAASVEPPPRRVRRLTVVDADARGESPAEINRARVAQRRAPLLAVCGLCGGAGASTLAYLIALAAARSMPQPVLVGDTGGPSGGLACYTGVATPMTLDEVADRVADGLPTGQLVVSTDDGLRVLAGAPRMELACAREGVELVLSHAREMYALTVIDCGTLAREADQVALAKASHVAWVVPATDSGVRRAGRVLEAVTRPLGGREMLVARHDERAPRTAVRRLKRLAEGRRATLVLLPSLPDLAAGNRDKALVVAQVSLQAIEGVLQR